MLVELELCGTADCKDISVEVALDGNVISLYYCSSNNEKVIIDISEEEEKDQILSLTMKGKASNHTEIDQQGNIISDVTVIVKKIIFDDIDVTDLFCSGQEIYTHNFNGTQPTLLDEFYGIIGCNGIVHVSFSTPIYLWFLQQE